MQAAVLSRIGGPLELAELRRPDPGPDEVVVETRTCGICRTDLHIQDGLAYVPALPHVPGHEPAGVVFEVGSRVRHLRPGQRVVPHLFLWCGECRYCRAGQHAQCTCPGGIIGVTRPGGFAGYFAAPARNLLAIPDSVGFAEAGLVSCALVTAVHAFRRAELDLGDTAVVVGAGGIGLAMVQLLRHAGVRVAAVSRSEGSLALARAHGAQMTALLGAVDAARQVREFAGGHGAAAAFEMVGLAQTMAVAADCVQPDGRIVVIGEEPQHPAIETIAIAQRELRIVGSRNGGLQDAAHALELLAAGVLRPPVDSTWPLERINEALAHVRSGRAHGRLIVQIHGA